MKDVLQVLPNSHTKPESTLVLDAPAPLRLWHLASLDAPTVALVWSLAFAWVVHIRLPLWVPALLALAVWSIYIADRLLDARAALREPALHLLRERHLFHWRNRRILLPLAVASAAAAACIIFAFMPRRLPRAQLHPRRRLTRLLHTRPLRPQTLALPLKRTPRRPPLYRRMRTARRLPRHIRCAQSTLAAADSGDLLRPASLAQLPRHRPLGSMYGHPFPADNSPLCNPACTHRPAPGPSLIQRQSPFRRTVGHRRLRRTPACAPRQRSVIASPQSPCAPQPISFSLHRSFSSQSRHC